MTGTTLSLSVRLASARCSQLMTHVTTQYICRQIIGAWRMVHRIEGIHHAEIAAVDEDQASLEDEDHGHAAHTHVAH